MKAGKRKKTQKTEEQEFREYQEGMADSMLAPLMQFMAQSMGADAAIAAFRREDYAFEEYLKSSGCLCEKCAAEAAEKRRKSGAKATVKKLN